MADKTRIDHPTGTETVGHEWDGIEELNTPLPRWWLWTFYASIVFAIVYMVLYPAWPMFERATAGTLGWTSRGELDRDMRAADALRAPKLAAIAATDLNTLTASPELMGVAVEGGRAAFKVHCVQCHGSGADGVRPGSGYPNLNDDDWLWGGDIDAIHFTLTHGIRNPDHDETRQSLMPAFGRDGILQPAEIEDVVSHVRTLSGAEKASASSARGKAIFAAQCAACHGANGQGDRNFGAPNLTDGIWLFGGGRDQIAATVGNARAGVMPRWNDKLDPVTIKMLAAYVHALGGGEAAVPAVVPPAAAQTAPGPVAVAAK